MRTPLNPRSESKKTYYQVVVDSEVVFESVNEPLSRSEAVKRGGIIRVVTK